MGTFYVGCKVENHRDEMEGMNVQVDPRRKRLVAAGPVVAA
jgi:hypothetical protein